MWDFLNLEERVGGVSVVTNNPYTYHDSTSNKYYSDLLRNEVRLMIPTNGQVYCFFITLMLILVVGNVTITTLMNVGLEF